MNKMKKFEVYTLDTFPDDEDGGWVENERQKIGTIEIQSGEQALPVVILDALRNLTYRDVAGREHHILNTTDRRRIYVEDFYGTGEWWEVGTKKGRKPFLGLHGRSNSSRRRTHTTTTCPVSRQSTARDIWTVSGMPCLRTLSP